MTLTRRRFAVGATVVAPRRASQERKPIRAPVRGFAVRSRRTCIVTTDGDVAVGAARPAIRHQNRPAQRKYCTGRRADSDGYTLLRPIRPMPSTRRLRQANYDFTVTSRRSRASSRAQRWVNLSVPTTTVPNSSPMLKPIQVAQLRVGWHRDRAGGLFNMMAGVGMVHVPYRGGEGPALIDLIGGQVQECWRDIVSIDTLGVVNCAAGGNDRYSVGELCQNIPTRANSCRHEANGLASGTKNTSAEIVDKSTMRLTPPPHPKMRRGSPTKGLVVLAPSIWKARHHRNREIGPGGYGFSSAKPD